jgi:putative effector of murein hydrolase LrgA (UPF0299 family)
MILTLSKHNTHLCRTQLSELSLLTCFLWAEILSMCAHAALIYFPECSYTTRLLPNDIAHLLFIPISVSLAFYLQPLSTRDWVWVRTVFVYGTVFVYAVVA